MMVVLSRDFCLPCQVIKPWVGELRREYAGRVDVVELNFDRERHRHLAAFFRTSEVPTLVFVDPEGRIAATREGVVSKKEMTATFRRLGWLP